MRVLGLQGNSTPSSATGFGARGVRVLGWVLADRGTLLGTFKVVCAFVAVRVAHRSSTLNPELAYLLHVLMYAGFFFWRGPGL